VSRPRRQQANLSVCSLHYPFNAERQVQQAVIEPAFTGTALV